MRKHHDTPDNSTGSGFGKPVPEGREQAKHIDDKDFKKGKSTTEQRGDEDEM
jgi:hypothetical protein